MSWDDLLPDNFNWPKLEEVKEFRNKVRSLVCDLIDSKMKLEDNTIIDWNHQFWVIYMAIEHEKIHLETSSVLIR